MVDQPRSLDGRPVLVTGGSGFIGRHLLRRLESAGARVHATTRRAPRDADGDDLPSTATWHQLDLTDPGAVRELFDRLEPRVLFHLASHVAGSRALELVRPTFEGNLASTVHLLEAAARTGVDRFVQVGSLEEPDAGEAPVPSSPYAAAKAAASAYGRMFHLLYETPVVIARVFMVYGPGRQDEKKLVPYVIRSLLAGEEPSFGSGTRPVDWVFAPDVAEGFVRLATAPGLEGRTVELGTGELTTVRGVVEELFRQLAPGVAPSFGGRDDRPAEQVRRADVAATEAALGWRPRASLAEGLAKTIDWFREHPPNEDA